MAEFKKSILIVEDENIIAEDLSDIIVSAGYRLSGVAYDYAEAIDCLDKSLPDLILLDINLNSIKTGLDLAKLISKKYKLPYIFLTSYADQKTVSDVIALNPLGYLVKPYKEKDIVTTLALAFAKIAVAQKTTLPSIEKLGAICNKNLSRQEYKVLELMMEAHTNSEIAENLHLSINTIKSHVAQILSKMNAHSKLQAVQKVNGLS